jgi:hypothetical protein
MESDEGVLYEILSENLCMEMTKLTSLFAEGNKVKSVAVTNVRGSYGKKKKIYISYSNMSYDMYSTMLYSSDPKEDQ